MTKLARGIARGGARDIARGTRWRNINVTKQQFIGSFPVAMSDDMGS